MDNAEIWTALVIVAFFLGCAFGSLMTIFLIRQIKSMEVTDEDVLHEAP